MKNILHVDLNAFYASVEQALNQDLCGKPVAVSGDREKRTGIVLTASYEARKFGVKTGMIIADAKKACPEIIFIKPHFKQYSKYSRFVMDILRSFTPDVEQFSIDEAWLDVTGCMKMFKSPVIIADMIREKIKKNLNITASVGVSYCKVMAKMASDLKKPNATTVINKNQVMSKIWPLEVGKLFGVGRRMRPKLNELGIYTIGDLAAFNAESLEKKFGKAGRVIWYYANGIDDSNVLSIRQAIKGIGNSTTTVKDIENYKEAREVIMELCENVSRRVRESSFEASVVEIVIKTAKFEIGVHREKLAFYTSCTDDIYNEALKLLYENWNGKIPLRLLGVRVSGFKAYDGLKQISFFKDRDTLKKESLDRCIDKIREKYGYESVVRGTLLTVDETYISGRNGPSYNSFTGI